MNLTITNDMTIKWLHEGVEHILDKLVLNQNGVDNTVYDKGSTPSHDYSQDYFTIEILEGTNASLAFKKQGNTAPNITLSYKKNDESWKSLMISSSVSINNLQQGDKIQFRAAANYWATAESIYVAFGNLKQNNEILHYKVYGNVLSLLYSSSFINYNSLRNYKFVLARIFQSNASLLSAENLILPDPINSYCYDGMFGGCTSLVTCPKLPNTVSTGCYVLMFSDCTSLTTAPVLPATTLTDMCYYNMFYNCTNLNYVKCLATMISGNNPTGNWLVNVAASGTFVKDANMSSWSTGTSGIPSGWTVQDA